MGWMLIELMKVPLMCALMLVAFVLLLLMAAFERLLSCIKWVCK